MQPANICVSITKESEVSIFQQFDNKIATCHHYCKSAFKTSESDSRIEKCWINLKYKSNSKYQYFMCTFRFSI